MRSIRSGASSREVFGLKEALAELNDPKLVDEVLAELGEKLLKIEEAQKSLDEKSVSLEIAAKAVGEKSEKMEKECEFFVARVKKLKNDEDALALGEKELATKLKAFEENKKAFDEYSTSVKASFQSDKEHLDERSKALEIQELKAQSLVEEYESKLAKLKAVIE